MSSNNRAKTKTSSEAIPGKGNTVTVYSGSDNSSDDDTPNKPGATSSVLELVPAESNYRRKTKAELATISNKKPKDLRALAAKIPCTYDHVPEDVWIALTTGGRGIKDKNDLITLHDVWKERMDDMKSIHEESLLIVQNLYPNLYAATSKKVKLDYKTMRTRFSQDGERGTQAGVDISLVDRMYDVMVRSLSRKQQEYLIENGDLIADGDSINSLDTKDADQEQSRVSKRPKRQVATKPPNSTPTAGDKRRPASPSSSDKSKTSRPSKKSKNDIDDVTPVGKQSSPISFQDVYDIVHRGWSTVEETHTRIDDLLTSQALISDVLLETSTQLRDGAELAVASVDDLQRFYESVRKDRDTLISNYTRVIDILYSSYLEQFLLLHSSNMWYDNIVKEDEDAFKERLAIIGRQLHPKPIPPSRNRNTLEFKDTADVLREAELHDPHETVTKMRRLTRDHHNVVSVLRFSSDLQSELDSMEKIPSSGMINVDTLNLASATASRVRDECEGLRDVYPSIARLNQPKKLLDMLTSLAEYQEQIGASPVDDSTNVGSTNHSDSTSGNDGNNVGSSYSHHVDAGSNNGDVTPGGQSP